MKLARDVGLRARGRIMATKNEEMLGCGFLVLVLLVLGAVIYYSGRWIGWWSVAQPDGLLPVPVLPAPPSPFLNKEQRIGSAPINLTALKEKVKDAKSRQRSTGDVIAKLKKEKQAVLVGLKNIGVRSPSDLKSNAKGQLYAQELLDVVKEITLLTKIYDEREEVIARLESAIRRSERLSLLKEAGATEEKLDQELDSLAGERATVPEAEIDRVLAQELTTEYPGN